MKQFSLQEVFLNETCNKGRAVQYLSHVYPNEFCVKKEDVSAVLNFRCAIVYGVMEVPANEKSLKLNEKLSILFCGKDDYLLGENKQTYSEGNERRFSWSLAMRIVQ